MAITSEIIGKLGGADVESVPVSGETPIGSGSTVTLHTVEVPAGETWLVSVTGDMPLPTSINASQQPDLSLGQFMARRVPRETSMGLSAVITETTTVELTANSGSAATFTGHVYTVKM